MTLETKLKMSKENLDRLKEEIENDPFNPHLYRAASIELEALGKIREATEALQTTILLSKPELRDYTRLGDFLLLDNDPKSAEAVFRDVITLWPLLGNGHLGLAQALCDQSNLNEALIQAEYAVDKLPNNADCHYLLGQILQYSGQPEKAINAYKEGLKIEPNDPKLHVMLGSSQLCLEKFSEGFEEFEWRHKGLTNGEPYRHCHLQRWDGKASSSECILLWREQGIGDEIFHLGWIRSALEFTHSLTIECDPRLSKLIKRSYPKAQVVCLGDSIPERKPKLQLPMGSLPRLFWKRYHPHTLPSKYLRASPGKTAKINQQLCTLEETGRKKRIGLSWKSIHPKVGAFKSIELKTLSFIGTYHDAMAISLQYNARASELNSFNESAQVSIANIDIDHGRDLDTLASLIDCCDLVITTSNITSHLAGALGKECWVLLPHGHGLMWHWHARGAKCRWYPTVQLFRQVNHGDWESVLENLKRTFKDWITVHRLSQ